MPPCSPPQHIAFEFAKLGAKLVLAARREDRLQSVAEACQKLGSPEVETVIADVRKEDDCKAIIDRAVQKFKRREAFCKLVWLLVSWGFSVALPVKKLSLELIAERPWGFPLW